MIDVVIAGAGPAGLFLSARLAQSGLHVRCVGIGSDATWPQHYGMWASDLDHTGLASFAAQRWKDPEVVIDEQQRFVLSEPYAMLDNAAVQAHLRGAIKAAGGEVINACIASVHRDSRGAVVTLSDGVEIRSRLVVDATGYPGLGGPSLSSTIGWQTAWGEIRPADAGDPMVLMDFSRAFSTQPEQPSFLYRLPMAHGTLFEETVLVARPAVSPDILRDRLYERMGWGSSIGEPLAVERCEFAMGTPRRREREDALGFGAAGGMVHPATGYSLGHVLRWAHDGAPELAALLQRGVDSPQELARVWTWPADRSRAHALYVFGMGVLAGMNLHQTRQFFSLFFSESTETAMNYLRWRLSPDDMRGLMWSMFRHADAGTRLVLARSGFSLSGARMIWKQR